MFPFAQAAPARQKAEYPEVAFRSYTFVCWGLLTLCDQANCDLSRTARRVFQNRGFQDKGSLFAQMYGKK